MFILSFFFHHRLLSLSWPCCHYDVLSEPELVSQNMMLSRYFFLLFWGNRTWWYRIISSWYASVKPPLISYDIRVVSPLLPLPSHAFELHWLFNFIYDSLQLSWIMLRWNFYLCSPEAKKNSNHPQIKLKEKNNCSHGLTRARRLSLESDWCGMTGRLSAEHSLIRTIIYTHTRTHINTHTDIMETVGLLVSIKNVWTFLLFCQYPSSLWHNYPFDKWSGQKNHDSALMVFWLQWCS